jgi:hypothetical protein
VIREVDPFDLPEWLGDTDVTWTAGSPVTGAGRVTGELAGDLDGAGPASLACDLLAADVAYPQESLEPLRRRGAHQHWTHGQVLLVDVEGRLTLAVPGTAFTADLVLESLRRLAKAVGGTPSRFAATLRL